MLLDDLTNAHSLAFKDGYLYIATTPAVMRVNWENGKPSGEPENFVDLPTSTPSVHVSRTIIFGPDGRLYVAIGSSCNVCVEADPRRTTIQVINTDGALQPFARGLHNAIGFDWDPQTGRMWASDTGQDNLGDEVPPDEINQIEGGKHYGFPFFIGQNDRMTDAGAQRRNGRRDGRGRGAATARTACAQSPHGSAVLHAAPNFPAPYRSALFLAMHGSSREEQGYKVVRVVMKDGRPTGPRIFATGWLKDGIVLGRPAGLVTGADGALVRVGRQQGIHLPNRPRRQMKSLVF